MIQRRFGVAGMALDVVRSRAAIDSDVLKSATGAIRKRASSELSQIGQTATMAAKSNLTGSQLIVLASGAGLRPTQVLGATPSATRDEKILNSLKKKSPVRRDLVAAVTAVSDAAYVSNRIPDVVLTRALPAAVQPLLGMTDEPSAKKKNHIEKTNSVKKSADDTAAENKAPSPLTLALRFAGFFAIIANGISSVIGPDLLVISKRVTSRLSDALLDPKKPRPTTLLDGLQLSEDAILKEIRLAPTKGVAGFLFSEGDPSSFEANIIDDASSSRLLLQGDDNDELRRRQEGEKK